MKDRCIIIITTIIMIILKALRTNSTDSVKALNLQGSSSSSSHINSNNHSKCHSHSILNTHSSNHKHFHNSNHNKGHHLHLQWEQFLEALLLKLQENKMLWQVHKKQDNKISRYFNSPIRMGWICISSSNSNSTELVRFREHRKHRNYNNS